MKSLTDMIHSHYKAECMSAGYSILGSMNIIGNPSQIMRDFSSDFQDLSDKPFLEMFAGGATAFTKNTVGGYF